MHPIYIAKRVLEERWNSLDAAYIFGAFAKYGTGRRWDFEAAASACGKAHLCRFRLKFTYEYWLWWLLDIQRFQVWRVLDFHSCEMHGEGDDLFQVLGLEKEFNDAASVSSNWHFLNRHAINYRILEKGSLRRKWRSDPSGWPMKISRKTCGLDMGVRALVASHLGVSNTL